MSGELKKLKITAQDESGQPLEYVALVNPESYVIKNKIVYNGTPPPAGNIGKDQQFNYIAPPDLQVDILFDSTGVIPKPLDGIAGALSGVPIAGAIASAVQSLAGGGSTYNIIDEIAKFKKVVYDYNATGHAPRTVTIAWGTLYFTGNLTSLQFNYKLFKPDGSPLRVIATAAFTGTVEDDLQKAMKNSSSPDMTHIRVLNRDTTLPLMSFKIYGDAAYYLEVARVNNLINFRNPDAGTIVKLPPVDKSKK